MKYPLIESLPACTEAEINKAFDYMDEWSNNLVTPFTLEKFYAVFPNFSGSESKVIFNSWSLAKQNVV